MSINSEDHLDFLSSLQPDSERFMWCGLEVDSRNFSETFRVIHKLNPYLRDKPEVIRSGMFRLIEDLARRPDYVQVETMGLGARLMKFEGRPDYVYFFLCSESISRFLGYTE